jgi:hypothetical protein
VGITALSLCACAAPKFDLQPGQTQLSFEQTSAKCRIMARHSGSGFMAIGSPNYVAGAALGHAIGEAVRTAADYKDCMIASGFMVHNDKSGG